MKLLYILAFLFFQIGFLYADKQGLSVSAGSRTTEVQILYERLRSGLVEPPGWFLQNGFPASNDLSGQYLNRNTEQVHFGGFGYSVSRERSEVHWNMLVAAKGNSSQPEIYLGKNSYIAGKLWGLLIGVGRKEHSFRSSPFIGYSDGGEGVFFEKIFSEHLKAQVFLWDYYQGYRLFEKEFLSPEIISNGKKERATGQRRRHSLGLTYGKKSSLSLGIQYLEQGSWGKQSREIEPDVKEKGGDGDSLVTGVIGGKFDWNEFYLLGEFLWAKGTDRTYSKSIQNQGSLPVEGEAVSFGVGWKNRLYGVRWSHFLNDSDRRSDTNKLYSLGFIGTGTHLGSTLFLSQVLQIYPGGFVTGNGLERNQTLLNGRTPAYYSELILSYNTDLFSFRMIGAYFLPYLAEGKSDGKISFKKERFEMFFLAESGLETSIHLEGVLELGVLVSYLWSSESLGLQGTMVSSFGRIQF
ncbi:hypothetical protein LPTSP3_g22050 [Leptospira kobayashii]|uniref:Outer membrane protein n=1 Tax=Leptospira kobayashii TaxID=1917830 RepID=A0ABM7UK50_9LEPT|nr:hypothetical protein [Leptospira kobayashii]BDA79275.1 hypothetical protein LPTSP3_g22050 [Leptospira kobayashii]